MESVESNEEFQFYRGYWTGTEDVTRLINNLDTENMTGNEVRSVIYNAILELRPYGKFKS